MMWQFLILKKSKMVRPDWKRRGGENRIRI